MGFLSKLFGGIYRSIPFFKGSGSSAGNKKHPIDQFFNSLLSKTNLSAPPLDNSTALKILNIESNQKQIDPKFVLERYYTLYKKNQPKNGGTAYLQSKIKVAKETLMSQFPNAAEVQQLYFKEVVEPQQKAEEEKSKIKKEEVEKEKKVEREHNEKNEKDEKENDKNSKSHKPNTNNK